MKKSNNMIINRQHSSRTLPHERRHQTDLD